MRAWTVKHLPVGTLQRGLGTGTAELDDWQRYQATLGEEILLAVEN